MTNDQQQHDITTTVEAPAQPPQQQRWRLMNTTEVRLVDPSGGGAGAGRGLEWRADTVEITVPENGRSVSIVLLDLYPHRLSYDARPDPRFVGRIELEGRRARVRRIDEARWVIETGGGLLSGGQVVRIRTIERESIWVDRAFGYGPAPESLRTLWEQLRASQRSAIIHERLMRVANTPEQRNAHATSARVTREGIDAIHHQIRALEKSGAGDDDNDNENNNTAGGFAGV